MINPGQNQSRQVDVMAAALLAIPAVLTLVLILHHPVLHGKHDVASVAAGIQAHALMDRLVHGGLITVLGIQTLGFYLFSAKLGWRRPAVAGGLIAYTAGVLLMIIPSTLDGFVTPDLASNCLAAAHGCGTLEEGSFRLVAVMIQDFTKLALVVMSTGVLSWSVALLASRDAPKRIAGVVGIICACMPVAILLHSDIYLQAGNLPGMIASQLVWSLLAAALIIGGERGHQRPEERLATA